MKTKRIAYLIFLSLFSMVILLSIYNYLFNYESTLEQFTHLHYPEHIILPLVILQTFGLLIVITNKGGKLINLAYAGFFFNLIFAVIAHYSTHQGNGALAVITLLLLVTTYYLNCMLKNERKKRTD